MSKGGNDTSGGYSKRIASIDPSTSFTEVHDRLPEFLLRETLPPHNVVSDVPDETLESVLSEA